MRRLVRLLSALGVGLASTDAGAVDMDWRDHVTFTLSERVRGEFVDWFRPPPGAASSEAHRYAFFASQLRAGVRVVLPQVQLTLEMQDTRLVSLPEKSSLDAPFGSLGPGASYFAHTHRSDQGELFLKQGFLTVRLSGITATVGRFEYSDGLETSPADPSLAWLKRARLAERLVGPFGFTHVTRSFDGVRAAYDRPGWNATVMASHPTHGGFEVSANREMDDVSLAGAAFTLKGLPNAPPADVRLFYLFYEDARDHPVKVDNRSLAARQADGDAIAVHSWGGHAASVADLGPGRVDALLWTALQAGEWGADDHRAWAYAVEGGYQLPRLPGAPWLRVGYNRSAGDDDPDDREHDTFFQVLPTARLYAQFPFFNLMNTEDLFTHLILRPHPRVTVRTDYHWLRVTEGHDLWYAGGGAGNDDVFGYSGTPARGRRDLAHLVDVEVSLALPRRFTLSGYYGHAFGQGVVQGTFAGAEADYGFVELAYRY